jgi:hypothetical protein
MFASFAATFDRSWSPAGSSVGFVRTPATKPDHGGTMTAEIAGLVDTECGMISRRIFIES